MRALRQLGLVHHLQQKARNLLARGLASQSEHPLSGAVKIGECLLEERMLEFRVLFEDLLELLTRKATQFDVACRLGERLLGFGKRASDAVGCKQESDDLLPSIRQHLVELNRTRYHDGEHVGFVLVTPYRLSMRIVLVDHEITECVSPMIVQRRTNGVMSHRAVFTPPIKNNLWHGQRVHPFCFTMNQAAYGCELQPLVEFRPIQAPCPVVKKR